MTFGDKDYQLPSNSPFMRMEEGKNRFRILGEIATGYEQWVSGDDGYEVTRVKEDDDDELGVNKRYFIATTVYNYSEKKIQALILPQRGLIKSLLELIRDEAWGDPKEYDLVVTREGSGKTTTYSLTPQPKKAIDPSLIKDFNPKKVDLNRIYDGESPFDTG